MILNMPFQCANHTVAVVTRPLCSDPVLSSKMTPHHAFSTFSQQSRVHSREVIDLILPRETLNKPVALVAEYLLLDCRLETVLSIGVFTRYCSMKCCRIAIRY